jgi:hypothetical protein
VSFSESPIMEKFYTDRKEGRLCDGFLSTAIQVNEKKLTYQI